MLVAAPFVMLLHDMQTLCVITNRRALILRTAWGKRTAVSTFFADMDEAFEVLDIGRGAGPAAPGAAVGRDTATVELVADPPTVGLGAAVQPEAVIGRALRLRNVTGRPLSVLVDTTAAPPAAGGWGATSGFGQSRRFDSTTGQLPGREAPRRAPW